MFTYSRWDYDGNGFSVTSSQHWHSENFMPTAEDVKKIKYNDGIFASRFG